MIGTAKDIINFLMDADKTKLYEINEHKRKRSLNANSYMWALINQIANITKNTKENIYFQMLKDYGQSEMISIVSEVRIDGYFKYYEIAGESMLNGKSFTHYKIYKGSSEYDSKEMAVLLDGVIYEAEQLGIQTMTPDEIAKLKSMWRV